MGWGIGGVIVAIIVVASILDGEKDITDHGNSGGVDQNGEKCEGCRNAKRQWKSWSLWKRARRFGWYAYKKAQCNLSGCPF